MTHWHHPPGSSSLDLIGLSNPPNLTTSHLTSIAMPILNPVPLNKHKTDCSKLLFECQLKRSPTQSPLTQSVITSPIAKLEDTTRTTVVGVSFTFFPGWHASPTDLIFSSSDSVLFHLHSWVIKNGTQDAFRSFLPQCSDDCKPLTLPDRGSSEGMTVKIPESSEILNIILHALYGMSPAGYSPSFDILQSAVNSMPKYGITPKAIITSGNPIYDLLSATAPMAALRLYALAAHHDLYDLAVIASPHLLSFDLSQLSDELANFIGPSYLWRLMSLHIARVDELKKILLQAPDPHPPTAQCGYQEQESLARAWSLVSAYLAWDARPDISIYCLQFKFGSLTDHLTCDKCIETFQQRVGEVISKWSAVKASCYDIRVMRKVEN